MALAEKNTKEGMAAIEIDVPIMTICLDTMRELLVAYKIQVAVAKEKYG